MKRTIFIIYLLLFTNACLLAQKQESVTVKAGTRVIDYFPIAERYLYPNFTKGIITLKNGRSNTCQFNLNFLSGEMEFIQSKDTLIIADKKDLYSIVIAKDTFYFHNVYLQMIRGGNLKVFMTEKATRGQLQATPAYGYRAENNRLVPIPEEARLVREIFRRFAAGEGYLPLAKYMNALGTRTHRGNAFERRTIEYIIRNPVYIGKLRWNPSGRTKRGCWDDQHLIVSEAGHQPLIDFDTWSDAQVRADLLKARSPRPCARPDAPRHHWLCGIVRCASCGSGLIFAAPHYFKCGGYVRGTCGTSQHIAVESLETAFLNCLRRDLSAMPPVFCRRIQNESKIDDRLDALRRQLAGVKRKKERLQDAFLSGVDTVEEYSNKKSALEREAEETQRAIDAFKEEPWVDISSLPIGPGDIIKLLTSPEASMQEKLEACQAIIASCTWDKTTATLSIVYRSGGDV